MHPPGAFLTYFAGQARTYGTQRIGLTSPNRRVVPMTRDYQYVAGRFGDLAELSQEQREDTATNTASFSPAVSYVDYAPSVEDILALCMTGFPSFDSRAHTVVRSSTSAPARSAIRLSRGGRC